MRSRRSRTVLFSRLLGGVALLVLGGCAGKPPGTSLAPRELFTGTATRTTEELRVFRGPFTTRKDAEFDFGELEITNGEAPSLSLYLTAEELARLETVDKTGSFEIRYWYHEQTYWPGSSPSGQGQLATLGNDAGLLIDRTTCELHHEAMKRQLVPVSYGLPMREFLEAARRDFPHAAFTLGGCVISNDSFQDEPAYACATCEVAHQAWTPPARETSAQ